MNRRHTSSSIFMISKTNELVPMKLLLCCPNIFFFYLVAASSETLVRKLYLLDKDSQLVWWHGPVTRRSGLTTPFCHCRFNSCHQSQLLGIRLRRLGTTGVVKHEMVIYSNHPKQVKKSPKIWALILNCYYLWAPNIGSVNIYFLCTIVALYLKSTSLLFAKLVESGNICFLCIKEM